MYFQTNKLQNTALPSRPAVYNSKTPKSLLQHQNIQQQPGLGVGDVGNIVLRDRKHLSQDGLIIVVVTISHDSKEIVSKPDVISRGFVYVREAESLIEGVKHVAGESISDCLGKRNMDWSTLKSSMKASVAKYIYEQTKRSPMILPIIEEI